MNHAARDVLALATAELPWALRAGANADFTGLSDCVAPWQQLYFECRLAGDDCAVDVSQHFFASSDADRAALADLAARGAGSGALGSRLVRLASAWGTDPDLAALCEVGLEYDVPLGRASRVPAVFGAFAPDAAGAADTVRRFCAIVSPAGEAACTALLAALAQAREVGLAPGRLVGAMLSRDAQLRCMVRDLTRERVARLAAAIGAEWDLGALEMLLVLLAPHRPALRLVLGFSPAPTRDFGIELIHPRDGVGKAATRAALAALVGAGLADADRVAALDAWPTLLTPGDARAPWPPALIARDLARGGGVTCFRGYLNHLKINVVDGTILPAKAYLALYPSAPASPAPGGADA